jgi:hypothetical protein
MPVDYEFINSGNISYGENYTNLTFLFNSSGFAGQNLSFGIGVIDDYYNSYFTFDSLNSYFNNSDNKIWNLSFIMSQELLF